MVSSHDYTPLESKDVESRISEPEDGFSYRERRTAQLATTYLILSGVLIVMSFLAGSLLRPFQWPSHNGNIGRPGYAGLDALNSLIPECTFVPLVAKGKS